MPSFEYTINYLKTSWDKRKILYYSYHTNKNLIKKKIYIYDAFHYSSIWKIKKYIKNKYRINIKYILMI